MKKAQTKWIFSNGQVHVQSGSAKKTKYKKYMKWTFLGGPYIIGLIIWSACYAVGYGIYLVGIKLSRIPKLRAGRLEKNISVLWEEPKWRINFAIFCCFLFFATLGLKGVTLVSKGLELKGKVLGQAALGMQSLQEAQSSLTAQDFDLAQGKFAQAIQNFKQGQTDLQNAGSVLSSVLSLTPQKKDGDNILMGAGEISKAGLALTNFYKTSEQLKITPAGVVSKSPVSEQLSFMQTQLNIAQDALSKANTHLKDVPLQVIPKEYQQTFGQVQINLSLLSSSLKTYNDIFYILRDLATGKKQVLLLFENNNELRPTGGFIGTFGQLKLNNGAITSLHVSSIYDLDGQLAENIATPKPLLVLGPRWYMRDSNWFASFPESAKKIISFYEKEGGETPDYTIVMTPEIIKSLLRVTGPITMGRYGITLSAENFVEATQLETSVKYDKQQNQPKQMLADFLPTLLQQLLALPGNQGAKTIEAIQSNLLGKQLLLYAKNEQAQNTLTRLNWAGQIRNTDRDYINVVSANLGGTKTDLAITQTTTLKSTVSTDGTVTNSVSITRTSNLPDQEGLGNNSFLRVFVPLGSKLISSRGFTPQDYSAPETNQKIDPDVYLLEKNTVRDVLSGTLIGQESGYTFFGNWVKLKGGESKTVELVYELPFKLNSIDRLSIMAQKQPGSVNQYFSYEVDFPQRQVLYNTAQSNNLTDHHFAQQIALNQDYFVGIVLFKQEQ